MASSTIASMLASPLGGVVTDIREWLESEKIEPVNFQAVVNDRSRKGEGAARPGEGDGIVAAEGDRGGVRGCHGEWRS